MELTLLGTGAPEGLPRPDCPCAVCASARGTGARAATALLVDDALLLDLTPGAVFAAARAGRSVAGVRQVLLTHPHDGPAMEQPASLPPAGRVPDGQELTLISGHRVRAVAMDAPGTGYEVTSPTGERLLYLPPGGAPAGLPDRAAEPYDMVVLDVIGRPDAVARLRAVDAVTAATEVIAVHLDHDAPPARELDRRLAAGGARAVPDGTTLPVGDYDAMPARPRRTLVTGGARSGKSLEAERRLETFPEVVYVATGGRRDGDAEWADRIGLHRERRPAAWRTEETCELVELLESDGPPLLIDCLSLWLTDAMDRVDAWDEALWADGGRDRLRIRVADLVRAVRGTRRTVVAVTNEVGSGVVPATPGGRRFRDELGRLNAAFAAECEHVLLVVAGQALVLRG
ncbi:MULTISPECIES: bifunctional adenosylcobinamide kinase/adenosylcobinamide-phosphate guanylyltransferase [unclassified Streptomyces]|uniref:bifunctional adenosylcobinamide kinase/adenosylcobinamide-phosphate guanylyltransferase n=1 Tax=unclassified Streptomyces TaxID=2593676 RepID=UPI0001C18EFA|nr:MULTISPECIES: bifunctional adenosylcobinamide kinase/adenosylcobinamide-phosphate guanylyltransferase [unclassified Streptomyces]MYR66593.1 adenosylcobinamide kinase/adenosylcobinamide phosphate guanyltransferase [Streptomyces sp. SID4939]MYR99575.1 adenosylcobinamide kinase/adenosylcobinamide phosphate guanyltransferase [Streptomyces sp. SID4940]MYT64626.1 adenosylcobinamide kinase/adenosylcobinamide phosphate guanyltransferase [Streptomyces sp. SID8357]MYT87439.1 adenosylcobinamide kinase/